MKKKIKTPEEQVAMMRAGLAKSAEKAGPFMAPSALGYALVELLQRGIEPTRAGLIEILREQIAATQSGRGLITQDIDIVRAPLESALALLVQPS